MIGSALAILEQHDLVDAGVLGVGLARDWISVDQAVRAAERWLERHPHAPDGWALDLVISDPEPRSDVAARLARAAHDRHRSELAWRLARLMRVRDCDTDEERKLDLLESIAADFDYPPDMQVLSRYYLPPDAGELRVGAQVGPDPMVALDRLIDEISARLRSGDQVMTSSSPENSDGH